MTRCTSRLLQQKAKLNFPLLLNAIIHSILTGLLTTAYSFQLLHGNHRTVKPLKRMYESRSSRNPAISVPESSRNATAPCHIAFICDGNSRWAKARNLPSVAGHSAGADRIVRLVESLPKKGVQYCTFYGFSSENWNRPDAEVSDILLVMERTALRLYDRAISEKVRFRILGDMDDSRLPTSLVEVLKRLEHETERCSRGNNSLTVCVAINYGGRRDILAATKQIVENVQRGFSNIDDISEAYFASLLSTSGVPDPDLIIRTSGERRLSNFLLWNSAYAELFFTDVFWPDFDDSCLSEALEWYSSRTRNYGSR